VDCVPDIMYAWFTFLALAAQERVLVCTSEGQALKCVRKE